MSEIAVKTAEGDATERDAADRNARVLELGTAGRGRSEIAKALGLSLDALAAEAAGDASLDAALRAASGLALAWWEQLAREACEAGRFNLAAAWTREMRWRFDEAAGPPASPQAARAAASARQPPETAAATAPKRDWKPGEEPFPTAPKPGESAIFLIPCNGRGKKDADGYCRCGGYHNDAYWAAEREAWYAEHPEERPDPALDGDDDDDWDDEPSDGDQTDDDRSDDDDDGWEDDE